MFQLSIVNLVFFTNKGQIGCLEIREHSHLYYMKKKTKKLEYITPEIQHCVNPNSYTKYKVIWNHVALLTEWYLVNNFDDLANDTTCEVKPFVMWCTNIKGS
jgi:hypothetical protein